MIVRLSPFLVCLSALLCLCSDSSQADEDRNKAVDFVFDAHERWAKEYDVAARVTVRTYVSGKANLTWWETEVTDRRTAQGVRDIVDCVTRGIESRRAMHPTRRVLLDYVGCTYYVTEPSAGRLKVEHSDGAGIFGPENTEGRWFLSGEQDRTAGKQNDPKDTDAADKMKPGCCMRSVIISTQVPLGKDLALKDGADKVGKQFLEKFPASCEIVMVWREEVAPGKFRGPFVQSNRLTAKITGGWEKVGPPKEADLSATKDE